MADIGGSLVIPIRFVPGHKHHLARKGARTPCAVAHRALDQAPRKLPDFCDRSLLQYFDFARFLIVRTIPFERKAR